MDRFTEHHEKVIRGTISGFDRLRFRGSLRAISYAQGMAAALGRLGILLKDFGDYAESVTNQLRHSVREAAQAAGCPVEYREKASDDKEAIARQAAEQRGVGNGLVCVLSACEPCSSFDIRRNPSKQILQLVPRRRVCLHYYWYFIDSMFGWLNLRLQTWFPFSVHLCLNGREWLARQLDAAQIGYLRRDNCFTHIDDFAAAQKLADQQLRIHWPKHLGRLVELVCPSLRALLQPFGRRRYWSLEQSEWATDVAFDSPTQLGALYPKLIDHALGTFDSREVMRFLGRKLPAHGGLHGQFAGEIVTDLAQRPEGIRIRHRLEGNSIKMYDKQGSVLRIETTIHAPKDLKVLRRKEGQSKGKLQWLPLRKGIADLHRRAKLSEAANRRYLEALAEVDPHRPAGELLRPLCQPVCRDGRRARGLRPFGEDTELLAAVARGEFLLKGFRNADIRQLLFGTDPADPAERRRRSTHVGYRLRILRTHQLIHQIHGTHRYLLTKRGQRLLPIIIALKNANHEKLMKAS